MPQGIFGIDSLAPASQDLLDQAAVFFRGQKIRFWGRYFKGPGSIGEYDPAIEASILRDADIRVLPIARQTAHVGSSSGVGAEDAHLNVLAIIAAFGVQNLKGQGSDFLVFLDVEGTGQANPNLSASYFTGWGQRLQSESRQQSGGSFTFLPCVYARTLDSPTWAALHQAAADGTSCYGAWVARLHDNACSVGPLQWSSNFAEPQIALPFEVFAWQFAQDCGALDYNQTNPLIDGETRFLNKLIAV